MTLQDEVRAALEGTTPGPLYANGRSTAIYIMAKSDAVQVASISWHSSTRQYYTLQAESVANAKMFAAAPDLLIRLSAALTEAETKIAWKDELIRGRNLQLSQVERERDEAMADAKYKRHMLISIKTFVNHTYPDNKAKSVWVEPLRLIDAAIAKGAAS